MGTEVAETNDQIVQPEVPPDATKEAISPLEDKIIRQIEYYFGNFNLTRDKFLKEQIQLDDGWVPLELLVKFQRLKVLTDEFEVIINALKKSTNGLMEVSEDATKIRRRKDKPTPDDSHFDRDQVDARSIYVKGFKEHTTLDEINVFLKDYKIESVSMRRYKNGNKSGFKGSVFVCFETVDDAMAFLKIKGLKYGNKDVLKETKKAYIQRKDEEFVAFKESKEKKRVKREEEALKDVDNIKDIKYEPGCLLKVSGLGRSVMREDIRKVLEVHGTIAFVDYSKGQPEAVVRFEESVASAAVVDAAEEEDGIKKVEIRSEKATISLIEGDEEKAYYVKVKANKAASFKQKKAFKANRGKFGKKNRNKRQYDDDDNDEEEKGPNKRQKKEADDTNNVLKRKSEDNNDDGEESSAKKIKTESVDNDAKIQDDSEKADAKSSEIKVIKSEATAGEVNT